MNDIQRMDVLSTLAQSNAGIVADDCLQNDGSTHFSRNDDFVNTFDSSVSNAEKYRCYS